VTPVVDEAAGDGLDAVSPQFVKLKIKTFAEQVDTGDQACCAQDKEHNQLIQ